MDKECQDVPIHLSMKELIRLKAEQYQHIYEIAYKLQILCITLLLSIFIQQKYQDLIRMPRHGHGQ